MWRVVAAAWWVPVGISFHDHWLSVSSISTASMQPALNDAQASSCDWVLLDKVSARRNWLSRGDVVMLSSPSESHTSMTSRIVGLEGDWVRPQSGRGLVHVPKGQCWIENDNTLHADDELKDSNQFGPVPLALVSARVTGIVWPSSRIGRCHVDSNASGRIVNFE